MFVACRNEDPSTVRPNVLFVTIDTLRADRIGAYGAVDAETPTLDALARDGVLFEQAVSHVPLTLPAHASMFTSLIPPVHGVRDNGIFRLDESHATLAELFHEAGYRTGAFVGAFVLDAQFGLAQGFEHYDDVVDETDNERRAEQVLASAVRWIEADRDDRPWFAFVHLFDPHAPYQAPTPFFERHRDDPYAGEIAYVDDRLGRFLAELRRTQRLENTLVVVTADHGEGLGEHGERTHGMFAYQSTMHVPLVFSWPQKLPRGQQLSSRVRHIDLAPTIAELAKIEAPDDFTGHSLVPLIRGTDAPADRDSYFESLTYSFNYGSAPLTGLYRDRFKLIALPIPELYDLVDDPGETENLASHRLESMRELESRLGDIVTATADATTVRPSKMTSEALERLESLGYVSSPRPLPNPEKYGPDDDPKNWIHLANMLDEAVNHHRAQRPEEAIRLLETILAEKDDVVIARIHLARILREQDRADEAIVMLEHALQSDVVHPKILNVLGNLLRETGNETRWTEVLLDVVDRHPQDLDALEALTSSLLRGGRGQEAIPHLVKLVGLRPEDAEANANLGRAYLAAGRADDSEAHLRRSLELDPNQAGTWSLLGAVQQGRGNLVGAIESWEQTLAIDERRYDTYVELALALVELQRVEDALRYLGEFLARAPDSSYREEKRQVREFMNELEARAAGQ